MKLIIIFNSNFTEKTYVSLSLGGLTKLHNRNTTETLVSFVFKIYTAITTIHAAYLSKEEDGSVTTD